MSYESDERYWTDYLRVALPVVGLLLMLGLLFWWANSIIGDEQGTRPTSTVATTPEVALAPTNTPPNTVEAGLTPTPVVNDQSTPGGGGQTDVTETPAGEQPTDTACDGDYANGDPAVVNDDGVNLRKGANLDSDVLDQLDTGTAVTIVSDCYTKSSDGTLFWRVSVDDQTSLRGYVSDDFLDPAA